MAQQVEIEEKKSFWRSFLEVFAITVLLTLLLRAYVVQAFRIPSCSMEDTLLVGDFVLSEKVTYRFRPPRRGELVVFKYPLNPEKAFIKRCVAVAGDTVVIRDKVLYVNGVPFPDPPGTKYTDPRVLSAIYSTRDNFGPVVVPPGHIFVIGDNRDNSNDSRFWGALPLEDVVARPLFIYFSWAPDPSAPSWSSPLSIFPIVFYNIIHFPGRVRWGRIGRSVR